MSIKATSVPSKRLAASITGASASFQLNNIAGWDGVDLTSADFGSVAYGVFRNDSNTIMELFEYDPATIASGSITFVRRGLKFSGDLTTEVSANKLTWIKNETIVELGAAVPQLLTQLVSAVDAETITGIYTFSASAIPRLDGAGTYGAGTEEYLITKRYADSLAIAGAPNSSTTQKGILESATQAEVDAKTATGGTGANLAVTPDTLRATKFNDYVADTGSANAYAIAPSPAITAYATGQVFVFKATNANTTTSTLNVNSLGTKTIKNMSGSNLAAGEISAGMIVEVVYDGTNMQMTVPSATNVILTAGAYPAGDASALTYARSVATYPRGETINGATTPVPVCLIDDTYQEEFGGSVTLDFGKVTTGNKHAIKFTPQNNLTLSTLKIYLKKQGTPTNNVVVKIETDSAGSPSGSVVTNGTGNNIGGGSLTTSFALTTVTLAGSVSLTANTAYWITFQVDATQSDTNYYKLDGIAAANTYGNFSGKTYNASAWSSGDVPFFQLVLTTGTGFTAYKTDTDHANFHHRFFAGFMNTDGAISASNKVIFAGVLSGFTGLTPNSLYYCSDTVGTIGLTTGTTESIVGKAISATEMLVGFGADKLQYIGSISLTTTSTTALHWGFQQGRQMKVTASMSNSSPGSEAGDMVLTRPGKTTASFRGAWYVPASGSQLDITWTSASVVTCATSGESTPLSSATAYLYR